MFSVLQCKNERNVEVMNRQECDVLKYLNKNKYENQRTLAKISDCSLGSVNQSLNHLIAEGYLDAEKCLTDKGRMEFAAKKPQNAIILAAGFGMRMVPINTETSKGLLEVRGEILIERLIRQLHQADIRKIYVVVGFMKEKYEYLIDRYGVELIVNPEYAVKNNLFSLKLAEKYMKNTYIIPSDIWCAENPFNESELYSWYMVSDAKDAESDVRVNRKEELVRVSGEEDGNRMIGIAYLLKKDSEMLCESMEMLCQKREAEHLFWEEALYTGHKMNVMSKIVSAEKYVEINTYEQLRELDENSENLRSDTIRTAALVLEAEESEIKNITVLKKGMTNRSFLFECRGQKYIMRIPGEGTDRLINRAEEAEVYQALKDRDICDDIIYINPDNGYKITKYLENARTCNPLSEEDLQKCMGKLRDFHEMGLQTAHEFDIFKQIEFYESLWQGQSSVFRDYKKTKEKVYLLKEFIDRQSKKKVLTHIDAVPDNFLFTENENGKEEIRLIDWEYAGMQDPHVDIAMFCIYSLYDRKEVERLIDIYFQGNCTKEIRMKIYCYIAACGLLWSNWCEYKRTLGVEFGEYSLKQYRYAKDYYKIFKEEFPEEWEKCIR